MTCTTVMNNIIEDRYELCICLVRIAKERDIKNKEKWELGEETQEKLDIFTIPYHIKRMFGEFMKTPLYTEIKTLDRHNEGVSWIRIHKNKLYSRSADNTIHIWNIETYEHIHTLCVPGGSMFCLAIHENKLYTGSWNNTIRVWNTETYKTIATLEGHTEMVTCLDIHENKLYSGSMDKTIRIWNI